eukprot:1532622-Alexandrium_andersonii.AAC.1
MPPTQAHSKCGATCVCYLRGLACPFGSFHDSCFAVRGVRARWAARRGDASVKGEAMVLVTACSMKQFRFEVFGSGVVRCCAVCAEWALRR